MNFQQANCVKVRHNAETQPALGATAGQAPDCSDARELLFLWAFGIVIIVPSEARSSGAAATDSQDDAI